jgi:hypothetical protein
MLSLRFASVSINLSKLADHFSPTTPAAADAFISAVLSLARASNIHERFRCNHGFAAATSLDAVARRPGRWARHSVGQHTISSMPPSLTAPRACLAWRLHDFATNRHE